MVVDDQRRQPKGAPASVGGQWAKDDDREATSIDAARLEGDQVYDAVQRLDAPAPGGYDAVAFDEATQTTTYLAGGVPHRTDGAAIIRVEAGIELRQYALRGTQVQQVDVWRGMAADPETFDVDYGDGWAEAVDAVADAIEQDADPSSAASREITALLDDDIDDDRLRVNQREAAFAIGVRDAARRMQAVAVEQMLEGGNIVAALRALRERGVDVVRRAASR